MPELTVSHLSHDYKKYRALSDVSFSLSNGVVALIGPNGAGKTTLINDITGLLRPAEGEILLDGVSIRKLGKHYYDRIGYCPQSPGFYRNFTAKEFLQYMAALRGLPRKKADARIETLLEEVNLLPQMNLPIGSFSGGMKQRLGIAEAVLHEPELLILDEPTAGLDPNERIRFRNMLSRMGASRIVILATHIISDVENIASHMLFLKQGQLIVNDTPEAVLHSVGERVWEIPDVPESEIGHYRQKYLVSNMRKTGDAKYTLRVMGNVCPEGIPECPNLEDAFLHYFHEGTEEKL